MVAKHAILYIYSNVDPGIYSDKVTIRLKCNLCLSFIHLFIIDIHNWEHVFTNISPYFYTKGFSPPLFRAKLY